MFSAAVLVSFIIALKKFRRRIHWIYRNAFHEAERVELKLDERKGPFNRILFIGGLIGVSVGGATITTLAILCR